VSRRLAGVISKRLPELRLGRVADPRNARGKRWKLQPLLTSLLVGMFAGCKGLGEVEDLTNDMAPAMRLLLGFNRRVPDTTMRDLLCRLDYEQLRSVLHRLVRKAARRKALAPDGLPFGAASMDGRSTATNRWEVGDLFAQLSEKAGVSMHALVRTTTTCLISSAARVCIDAHPIPAQTNETGVFEAAFTRLVAEFGGLFQVVLYDSGANSAKNAALVVRALKSYLFRVQAEQPTLFDECKRLLERKRKQTAIAETVTYSGGKITTRRAWATDKIAGYHDYPGLQVAIRVQAVTEDKTTGKVSTDNRYFISSMKLSALQPAQWLELIRRHWSVENNCHNTWDKLFREDTRPWIKKPRGMLNVMMLRRIAYTMMALFRSVTQRSDKARAVPWKRLMKQFYNAFIAATREALEGLRRLTEPALLR
jgi:hypothetical protein